MNYKISVKQFLEESKAGNIDYADFSAKVVEESKKLQEKYNFFVTINDKPSTPKSVLHGLPISVKDCICTKGIQSTAGSRILQGYVPPFDATAVQRIKEQGASILGKTQQDEFGFGTFSVNSGYGIPKNPIDPERTCGGSSGGAGGLTAALEYPHIAMSESTGGSIEAPSAFCGVVGIVPTYGLVSRYGLIDYANSLDKIGPIGKCVYDAALMLSIIAGHDKKDSTSVPIDARGVSQQGIVHSASFIGKEQLDYTQHVGREKKKIRIGIPKEYFNNVDKEVEKSVWNAIKKMESQGATYDKISLPNTKYALASYYIIATAEASTNLAKYCGLRYGLHLDDVKKSSYNDYASHARSLGFGEEAKRRIMLGTFARMSGYRKAYYLKAMQIRTMIINEFKQAFKKYDCIAAPTMPVMPPKFSEIKKLTPLQNYQMDILTVPANLAGIPHISIPCGKTIGLHLLGDHLQEAKLIEIASAYEAIQ